MVQHRAVSSPCRVLLAAANLASPLLRLTTEMIPARRAHRPAPNTRMVLHYHHPMVMNPPTQPEPQTSRAAANAQRQLLQDFHKPRANSTDCVNTTGSTSEAYSSIQYDDEQDDLNLSHSESQPHNMALIDLCGEAATTDDIAWRNALHLLSLEPTLARTVDPHDPHRWTPLHIACLGLAPPPAFLVRALLYVHPDGARTPDDGGRLPLHLVAASSADPDILQMLVDEHPQSVSHTDQRGLTPLHLVLRNCAVELTLETVQILLGLTTTMTTKGGASSQQQQQRSHHILQRRGEHLDLSLEELEKWRRESHLPVTTHLHHSHDLQEQLAQHRHERHFATYPRDVQMALRKLAQWKHRQAAARTTVDESVEVQLQEPPVNGTAATTEDVTNHDNNTMNNRNPAAIPLPGKTELPLHMLVQRALIDRKTVAVPTLTSAADDAMTDAMEVPSNSRSSPDDDDDDETGEGSDDNDADDEEKDVLSQPPSERPSVPHAVSVLRLMAAVYPGALLVRDSHGLTPLLQVMLLLPETTAAATAPPTLSLEIVDILLGKGTAEYAELPEWAEDLPVHSLRSNGGGDSSNHYLNPAMMAAPETGQLPLHWAAEEMASDYALVATIQQSYPGAIHVPDHCGRTPLHLALHSYRRVTADPRVVEVLFSERVAQMVDDYGNSPFDLLVQNASSLPASRPRSVSVETGEDAATTVYQKLFGASILGAARPDTPSKMSTFLRRLRRLPAWLRRDACATPYVQDLLVDELASPWKCACILLDGVLLATCITVFRQQMKRFVDQLESADVLSSWYTFAVYATATLRLCGLFIMGGLAVSLGEFGHLCLFNPWYWLDVWAMLLSIVTSVFLYGAASDERLLGLGTASTCLLWVSLIGYLSNWWHGMAVFTGGFTKIANRMVPPLICAAALVVGSAQCFYTLLQLECTDALGISPVCSVRDSYRVVYMLFRGEPVVDPTGTADFSTGAIVLVASVLGLFVVLLLALLVTILISASHLDFDLIALSSYWEPKLAFVLSSADFGVSRTSRGGDEDHHYSFTAKQARAWDVYVQTLLGGEPEKGANWFARPLHSKALTYIVAVFVVPIWILLGLATLGLLWPPQLRRWLFRPQLQIAKSRQSNSAGVAAKQTTTTSDIRNEIMQMKMMSYERSNDLENELRELKEMLRAAMQE